ncbi:MAG: hypothetical protein ACRCXB_19215 [Aeromonadaceae bacterium]
MSKHTPEPWRVGRVGTVVSDTPVPLMRGSDAIEYYGGHLIGESITEANARRIVVCVNVCAGMRNDELDGGLLIGVMQGKIDRLKQQRDELLAALEAVTGGLEASTKPESLSRIHKIADDAIAKAKGGAS